MLSSLQAIYNFNIFDLLATNGVGYLVKFCAILVMALVSDGSRFHFFFLILLIWQEVFFWIYIHKCLDIESVLGT